MSIDDSEKPFSTQIKHLNEKNYYSWSTQVHAILCYQRVLNITENEAKPRELEATASEQDKGQYKTEFEAWEATVAKANAILLSIISEQLMMFVENEDDPVRIWSILRNRFHPTSNVTLAQALKYIVTLRIGDDGDIEAHIRDFTAGKRRVEEYNVVLTDIIYCTFFILSMLTTYLWRFPPRGLGAWTPICGGARLEV